MRLSEHFTLDEFVQPGTVVPGSVIASLQHICTSILEMVRLRYNSPIHVTSGYRTPEQNCACGGVPTSYHLFDGDKGAVDFKIEGFPLQGVFDWIRLESGLAFDKVILERKYGAYGDEGGCIHLQVRPGPRREAYLGETGGTGKYVRVDSI